MARIGSEYKEVTKDGKTVLVKKTKHYDKCTELKQATSKRWRPARKGQNI